MSNNTKREPTSADHLRAALKRAGFTSKQVTVRRDAYSMGSTLYVTIRDLSIPKSKIEEIAGAFEIVRRCERSGEILSGGNRYLDVSYEDNALRAYALEVVLPQILEIPNGQARDVQCMGQSIRIAKIVNDRTSWNSEIVALDYQTDPARRLRCYYDCKQVDDAQQIHASKLVVELAIELSNAPAEQLEQPDHDTEQPIPVLTPSNCRPLEPFPRVSSDTNRASSSTPAIACQSEDWSAGL